MISATPDPGAVIQGDNPTPETEAPQPEHSRYQIFPLLMHTYQLRIANKQCISPLEEIRSTKQSGEDEQSGEHTALNPQALRWQSHFATAFLGHAGYYADFYTDLITDFSRVA